MRRLLLLACLAGAPVLPAAPIAVAPAGTPLIVVAAKVELTIGREMAMVSGRYMYQYVEKDDDDHQSRLLLQYPVYLEKGLKSLEDMISASSIRLQLGDQTFYPTAGDYLAPEVLSDYPAPEDAAVAMLTFEIPRASARLRFEVTITHLSPNFHSHGALLAAYTPWLPRSYEYRNAYGLQDHDFEVSLRAIEGFALQPFPTKARVLQETPTELVVFPEHRKTIAAEVVAVPATTGK